MKSTLTLFAIFALPFITAACSPQAPENSETEERIAICKNVMKRYIVEAKTYERDRERLIGSCHMTQMERTLEQWQCVLSSMEKGQKYVDASDKCGKKPPKS
ncbi:hypothetical protein [Methyloterricola oryzae]|uniref:hypothetical protein n=1 Tax=Methyloterricola oryzae TaxID=1495050 RepID=UPI0005EAFE83|nr:hypothetical protein [Methyloterricola oryzae]